jgi:hypothetical protein
MVNAECTIFVKLPEFSDVINRALKFGGDWFNCSERTWVQSSRSSVGTENGRY